MLTIDLVMTKVGAQEIGKSATIHVATAGILDLAKVHLTTNPVRLDENTVIAGVTGAGNLPLYTGYAAQSVTWSGARETSDGEIVFLGTSPEFNPSDAVTPSLIKSLAITDTAAAKVLFVANFPGLGVPLSTALDTLTPNILFRPQGGGSVEVLP